MRTCYFRRTNFKRLILLCIFVLTILVCVSLVKRKFENNKKPHNLHVSSAYFVQNAGNENPQHAVRLLVLSESGLTNSNLNCKIDNKLVPTQISVGYGPEYCKWRSYFIDCPVEQKPGFVSLISDTLVGHRLQLTEPDPIHRNLVVCFSPMYFYENWQILLASIELYKLYGADLLVIPLVSAITRLYTILRAHEREGTVRIKPAVLVPNFPDQDFSPNTEVEFFNQVLAYTECLYEYRKSAKFILNVDVDEILVPRNLDNLFEELQQLSNNYPNAGSFEFLEVTALVKNSPDPSNYKISNLLKSSSIEQISPHGRSVIVPKRVRFAFNSNVTRDEMLEGYAHKVLSETDALVVHLKLVNEDKTNVQPSTPYYATNNTTLNLVDSKFHSFLSNHYFAKLAFNMIHKQSGYLRHLNDFHQAMLAELNKETGAEKCPSPISFLSVYRKQIKHDQAFLNSDEKEEPFLEPQQYPPCVIIKNQYLVNRLSNDFRVSSVESSEFVPSPTCLF